MRPSPPRGPGSHLFEFRCQSPRTWLYWRPTQPCPPPEPCSLVPGAACGAYPPCGAGAALRRMGAAWKCLGNFSICETNLSFTTQTLTDHRATPHSNARQYNLGFSGTRRQAAALVTYVSWRRQCDIGGRPAGESPSEPGPTRPSSRCECTSGLRHGSPSWRCGMPRLRRVGVLRGGKSIETPCPGS